MKKEELKRELENVKTIYVVGIAKETGANRGVWRKFRLYYIKDGKLEQVWIDPDESDTPPNWVPLHKTKRGDWKGGYFESSALGVNRAFEVVYHLSHWLFGNGYRLEARFLSYEE